MPYRPQFAYPPTPDGWIDEEFEYYFDPVNTPGLNVSVTGQIALKIPLQLQKDAEFIWRGVQISGNTGPLQVRLYDAFDHELAATLVEVDREYSATLNGGPPIGRLPIPMEPEIRCPPGGFLQIDLLVL